MGYVDVLAGRQRAWLRTTSNKALFGTTGVYLTRHPARRARASPPPSQPVRRLGGIRAAVEKGRSMWG